MAGIRASFISPKLVKFIKFWLLVVGFIIFFTNLYLLNTKFQVSVNTIKKQTWFRDFNHRQSNSLGKSPISSAIPTNEAVINNLVLKPSFPASSLNGSCMQKINEVQNGILHFKNITIRSKLGRARVLETRLEHPKEKDEFFVLEKGFFTLYCDRDMDEVKKKLHKAKAHNALLDWVVALEVLNSRLSRFLGVNKSFQAGQYLAIQRIEYANVYWTVIDLLDIFITTQILGMAPEKLNIVLMDAHPPTPLDPFWSVPFHKLIKLGRDGMFTESTDVVLENLVWRYPRVNSPLLERNLQSFKYIQPFRRYVLERFGIPSDAHVRNCSHHRIKVLVIFRRDYHSHPRNLDGTVDRKIANEKEVLKEMKESFPNITITAVQLDALSLKTQLELVASADIFFGMHGSAHAFPIFMSPGGAVIEMFNFNSNNWHMGKIATLSGHSHFTWTMKDVRGYNKTTRSTTIPPGVTSELLRKAIQKICD